MTGCGCHLFQLLLHRADEATAVPARSHVVRIVMVLQRDERLLREHNVLTADGPQQSYTSTLGSSKGSLHGKGHAAGQGREVRRLALSQQGILLQRCRSSV